MSVGSPPARATGPGPQHVAVTLPTEIDITNSGQVYDTLARYLSAGTAVLVADATGTTFCDCSGVTALLRAYHLAAAAGAQLRVAASPAMRRILQLSGTDHVLVASPTVAAALEDAQQAAASKGDGGRAAGRTRDPGARILPTPRPPTSQE